MTLPDAKALINCDSLHTPQPQTWFDLGCGSGLFSNALAELLPEESSIYAIDQQPTKFKSKNIKFFQLDFVKDPLPIQLPVNGILMANSLHFVKDKLLFLNKVKDHLLPGGVFLVVEYDMDTPNPWVPYPVGFLSAQDLFKAAGFERGDKISERPSTLNGRNIYSALFLKQS